MKNLLYILVTLHLALVTLPAQPSITWQRVYGVGGAVEYGYSIVQTPDGGYISAGRKGGSVMYIIRLNAYGDTVWTKLMTSYNRAVSVIKSNDNNYVICGFLAEVVKIDVNGNILWGYPPSLSGWAYNIKQDFDNNYVVCGCEQSGPVGCIPYLLKMNQTGNIIYEKSFTNFWHGEFTDITISQDENYVMSGNYSDSNFLSGKLFIMKTDTGGNQVWFKGYDTLKYVTVSVANSIDGGYNITGYKGGPTTTYISKFNSQGLIQWIKYYFSGYNQPYSIIGTLDGGYALTGTWDTAGNSNYFVYLLKTDLQGNEQWHKTYGFNDNDAGRCVRQTSDSGYIINGIRDNYQWGDIYIIKTDKNGYATPIGIKSITSEIPLRFKLYQNFPNPFNPATKINYEISNRSYVKIMVFDVLGRMIEPLVNKTLNAGKFEVNFDGSKYSSGIYFYLLEADGIIVDTKKMVLLK